MFHHTAVKICRKFFNGQKRDMKSSVTRPLTSSFLKCIFVINWQVFVVFSTNLYTVLPLSNYTSIFKAEANES